MKPLELPNGHDPAGGDEHITAAVEADIERNTARIVRDYPLASLTPIIDGLHHFPAPSALPVRSWPLASTPSPLPNFSSGNGEGLALLDRPLDSLSFQERGYVDQHVEAAGRVMQQMLARQPVESMRFRDVPRQVTTESSPVPAVRPPRTTVSATMSHLDFPRPSPISGVSVIGDPAPSTASPAALLESYMRSAATASTSQPSTPVPNGLQTPKKRPHTGSPASSGQSPSFYISIPPSPTRAIKRSSASSSSLHKVTDMTHAQTASQRATEAAGLPATPTKSGQIATATAEKYSVDKLTSFLEDVFEAEDSFPDATPHPALATPVFLADGLSDSPPLLAPLAVRHGLKLVRAVVRSRALLQIPVDNLARLLKILERSVKVAEDLEAIPAHLRVRRAELVERDEESTPKKGKGKKKAVGSTGKKKAAAGKGKSSPVVAEEDEEPDELDGEDLDDGGDYKPGTSQSQSKRSSGHARSGSRSSTRSKSPMVNGETRDEPKEEAWSDDAMERLNEDLRRVNDSVLSSELSLALLTGATLPKQLYSEELITAIFGLVKTQLDALIYPCIEAAGDLEDGRVSGLAHPLRSAATKVLLEDTFRNLSAVLPLAAELIRLEEMPESIVISAVIVAIGPFFVDAPALAASAARKGKAKETFGVATLKAVQVSALSLLRNIFAKYPDQRAWIIEEIVNSLTKLSDVKKAKRQFRLRNGQTIHNVSALLMHLVQSTAHGVAQQVRAHLDRDGIGEDEDSQRTARPSFNITGATRPAVKASIESATMASTAIVKLLLERSKSSTKSSSEADYRAVFDHLVTDLLVVFDLPEWPVSSFMLNVCLRRMFSAMDVKQHNAEATAMRSLALDHLGAVGSKLCERAIKVSGEADGLFALPQILKIGDSEQLSKLIDAQRELLVELHAYRSEDGMSESAAEFIATRWAADLLRAHEKLTSLINGMTDDRDELAIDVKQAEDLLASLSHALQQVFAQPSHANDANGLDIDDDAALANGLYEGLAWAQGQAETFETLLLRILDVLQTSEAAGQRSKALKALGKIVEQDATIFARDDVRHAIEQRFKDTQPSVRDAAFDLLGGYVVNDPRLAAQYLPRIADRITDTGLSVRKRVIKLLRSIYVVVGDDLQRTEICRRLLSRVKDDDDGIKDLAVAAVEDIWFSKSAPPSPRKSRASSGLDMDVDEKPDVNDHYAVLGRSQIFMALAASMRERGSPLEGMLRLILAKYVEAPKPLAHLRAKLRELAEALVDTLAEPTRDSRIDIVGCAKALDIVISVDPSTLSVAQADLLLPYLQLSASASSDEHALREHLLRIYRVCVPVMQSSALPFATKLEATLYEMLKRPPMQQSSLFELVACLCIIVKSHTHNYAKLCAAFKRFFDTTKASINSLRTSNSQAAGKALMTITLLARVVALLCEHADFDGMRTISDQAADAVNSINTESIHLAVFELLVSIYSDSALPALRSTCMHSLGFLFRGFPTLMLDVAATHIMDDVFASSTDVDEQARLLGVMQDFLNRQAEKNTDGHAHEKPASSKATAKAKAKPVEVDMRDLIGNTDSFADSGVSSAIVQRYLPHILRAAQSHDNRLRLPAIDIIGFTIRQGLAHPFECLPIIVALETSPDTSIAKRMLALHQTLHIKHAELVHTRFLDCARASWTYLSQLLPRERLQGTRSTTPPTALFDGWYSLLREKRKWKLDYLRALLGAFAVDPAAGSCVQSHVDFARFVAENLAALDFKTQEEVFALVAGLDRQLADLGPQTCHLLEERLDAENATMDVDGDTEPDSPTRRQPIEATTLPALVRSSQVLSIALMLRDHLKSLYKVTDAKLGKYVPGKKSAAGDKAAVRIDGQAIALAYDRLPLAADALAIEDEEGLRSQAMAWVEAVGSDAFATAKEDED